MVVVVVEVIIMVVVVVRTVAEETEEICPVKCKISVEVSKKIVAVVFNNPNVVVDVDTSVREVEEDVVSLFIIGKYVTILDSIGLDGIVVEEVAVTDEVLVTDVLVVEDVPVVDNNVWLVDFLLVFLGVLVRSCCSRFSSMP